ncbi:hypothetical protein BDA96_02G377800 [Sorghum bicolor]|uniref:Uncharacterized protein n=1 Tax=Sorghum bicolor TaxID=4558 RepID=A0A921RSZ6_SORBI|nr:hypothetical protein BDA96_02G377800 [Sorghum bicolor]
MSALELCPGPWNCHRPDRRGGATTTELVSPPGCNFCNLSAKRTRRVNILIYKVFFVSANCKHQACQENYDSQNIYCTSK